ncbi:MAG TPA: EAL domain-containing protein [Acidiferrobacter sp.]|nr:EAL domain-containing protein [Acidiferrobacter sp.]
MPKSREARINWLAAILIVAVGLTVGLAAFFTMRATAEGLLRRSLESNLSTRTQEVARDIYEASRRVQLVGTRPFFAERVAAADHGQPVALARLNEGVRSFLPFGFSAIALRTRHLGPLVRAGRFMAAPTLAVPLKGLDRTELLWSAKQGYVVHATSPIRWRGAVVGEVIGEAPLPAVTQLFQEVGALNASTNLALCAPHGVNMTCFPPTLDPRTAYPDVSRSQGGALLPMSYALAGRSGFVVARNYRAHEVAAAYAPVPMIGLGMVLSMNTAALYAPVRRELWVVAPVMGLVLFLAILVLRWQLAPLVADLVTSEERAHEAVRHWRRSEGEVQAVLHHVDEGIATISEMGVIETFNPAMERLFGYTETEVVGKNISLLMPEPYRSHHDEYLRHYRETGEARVIGSGREVVGRHNDGSEFPVDIRVSEFRLDGSRRFIGTVRDASIRKAVEARMQRVATHDALTDLPNRTLIQVRMEQLIKRSERSGQLFAVMFVDLDRFKDVNDSLGHDIGDQVLCVVARRLMDILRAEDTVGRQGGDEFIVLAASLVAPVDAALIAEKILHTLATPYVIDEHSLYLGASVGVALYPEDGRDVDTLLKHSDLAMYQAKAAGRNTYQYFSLAMNAVATDRLILIGELHRALANEEFVLHYQPMAALSDGSLAAVEALVRWHHPQHGLMVAAEFFAIAEEAGLAGPLGEWVVTQACRQFHLWAEQGAVVPRLIIKLSSWQFRDQRLRQSIHAILTTAGMDPRRLGVEMTEGGVMENPDEAIATLTHWRTTGIEVLLGKFGTGDSSLSYLKKLPIDMLKIDSSFVQDCATNPDVGAMIAAIIAMTHQLGVRVAAEGVETAEQYAFLRTHGCDACQGTYISPPLAADECGPYLDGAWRMPPGIPET